MGLSVREILILDYFDGKPVHAKMPSYLYATYGSDADLCLDRLYADGWIRESTPRETVNMLPDKALSDFLKRYGLSGEGSHTELVRRVIHEVPEKNYNHAVPKVYVLEPKGRTEVGRHMAYVLNVRENYGLTEGEIGESRSALALKGNPCSARDILARAFQQKVSIYTMAGEWSKLRNLYYIMANFHLRAGEESKALSNLFLVFFLDMSGLGNRNTVIPYENLFPTQKGMILLLDEVRHRENMTAEEVKAAFFLLLRAWRRDCRSLISPRRSWRRNCWNVSAAFPLMGRSISRNGTCPTLLPAHTIMSLGGVRKPAA